MESQSIQNSYSKASHGHCSLSSDICSHSPKIACTKSSVSGLSRRILLQMWCRPRCQRPDFIEAIKSHNLNANVKNNNKPSFTEDEQKVYVRYHAVMNTLPNIPDMDEQDAVFFVGRLSGLDKLNCAYREPGVRPVALYLERLSNTWSAERRKQAVMKAFTWLTGYPSYEDAYDMRVKPEFSPMKGLLVSMIPSKFLKMSTSNIKQRSSWYRIV
jgi:hypothetical protein